MNKLVAVISLAVAMGLSNSVEAKPLEVGNFVIGSSTSAMVKEFTVTGGNHPNKTVDTLKGFTGFRLEYDPSDNEIKPLFGTVDGFCDKNNYTTAVTRLTVNGKVLNAISFCNPTKDGSRLIVPDVKGMEYLWGVLAVSDVTGELVVAKLDSGLVITASVDGYFKAIREISR